MTFILDNNKCKTFIVKRLIHSTRKRNRFKKKKDICSKTTDKKQNCKATDRIFNYGSSIFRSNLNALSFNWHVVLLLQSVLCGCTHGLTSQPSESSLNTNNHFLSTSRLIFATKSVSFYETVDIPKIKNTVQDHLIQSVFENPAIFHSSFIMPTVDKADTSTSLERLTNLKNQMSKVNTKSVISMEQNEYFPREPRHSFSLQASYLLPTPVMTSGPTLISLNEANTDLQVDIPETIQTISGKLSTSHSDSQSFVNIIPTNTANYQALSSSINEGDLLSSTIKEQPTSTFKSNSRYTNWLKESITDQSVIRASLEVSSNENLDLSVKIKDIKSMSNDFESAFSNIDNRFMSPDPTATPFAEMTETNGSKYIYTSQSRSLISSTDVQLKPVATLTSNEFLTGDQIFKQNEYSRSIISSLDLEVSSSLSIIQSTMTQTTVEDSIQSQKSNYRDTHQTESYVGIETRLWSKHTEDLKPNVNNSKSGVSSAKISYQQELSSDFLLTTPAIHKTTVISTHKTLKFQLDVLLSSTSTYRDNQKGENGLIATLLTFTNLQNNFEPFASVKHASLLETSFGYLGPTDFLSLSSQYSSTPSLPLNMDTYSTEQTTVSSKNKHTDKSVTLKSVANKMKIIDKSNSVSTQTTSLPQVSSIFSSLLFSSWKTLREWNPLNDIKPTTQGFTSNNIESILSVEKYVDAFPDIDNSHFTETYMNKILFTSDITPNTSRTTRIANTRTLTANIDLIVKSAKESVMSSQSSNPIQILKDDSRSYLIPLNEIEITSSPTSIEARLVTSFSSVLDISHVESLPTDLLKGTRSQDVLISKQSLDFYKLSESLMESKSSQNSFELSYTVLQSQKNGTVSGESEQIITQGEAKTHSESSLLNQYLNRNVSSIIPVATLFPFINDISVSDSRKAMEIDSSDVDDVYLYLNSWSIVDSADVLSKRNETNRITEEGSQFNPSFESSFSRPDITRSLFDYIDVSAKSESMVSTQQPDQMSPIKTAFAGTPVISLMSLESPQLLESSSFGVKQTSTSSIDEAYNIHPSVLNSEIISNSEIYTARDSLYLESGSNFDGDTIGTKLLYVAMESSSFELPRLSHRDTSTDLDTSSVAQPSLSSLENRDYMSAEGTYFKSLNQLPTTSNKYTVRESEDFSRLNIGNSFDKYSSVKVSLTNYEIENQTNIQFRQNQSYFSNSFSPFLTNMGQIHVTSNTMKTPSSSASVFQSSIRAVSMPATTTKDYSISISMLSISPELHGSSTDSILSVTDVSTQNSATFSVSTEGRNVMFFSVDRNEGQRKESDYNTIPFASYIASPSSTRLSHTRDSNVGSLLTPVDFSQMEDEISMMLAETKKSYTNKYILPTKTSVEVSQSSIDTLLEQPRFSSNRHLLLSEADLSFSNQNKTATESSKHTVSHSSMTFHVERSSAMSLQETSMNILFSETYKLSYVQFLSSITSVLQTIYPSRQSDSFLNGYKSSVEDSLSPIRQSSSFENNRFSEPKSSKLEPGKDFDFDVTSPLFTSEQPTEKNLKNSPSTDFIHYSSVEIMSRELIPDAEPSFSSIVPFSFSFDNSYSLKNKFKTPTLEFTDISQIVSLSMTESLPEPIPWEPLPTRPTLDSSLASFEYLIGSSKSILLKRSTMPPNTVLFGSLKTKGMSRKLISKYSTLASTVEPIFTPESRQVNISFYNPRTLESSGSTTQYLQLLSSTLAPVGLRTNISPMIFYRPSSVVSNSMKDTLTSFSSMSLLTEESASNVSSIATGDMHIDNTSIQLGLSAASTIFKIRVSNTGLGEGSMTEKPLTKRYSNSISVSPFGLSERSSMEGTSAVIRSLSHIYSEVMSHELISSFGSHDSNKSQMTYSQTPYKETKSQNPQTSFENVQLSSSFLIPRSLSNKRKSIVSSTARDLSLLHMSISKSSLTASKQVSVNLLQTSWKGLSETANDAQSGTEYINFSSAWLSDDTLSDLRSIFISSKPTERESLAGYWDQISKTETASEFKSDTRMMISLESPENKHLNSLYETKSAELTGEGLYPYTSPIFDSINLFTSFESNSLLRSSTLSIYPPVEDQLSVNDSQSNQSEDKLLKAFITISSSLGNYSTYHSVLRNNASATTEDRTIQLAKTINSLSQSVPLPASESNSYLEISDKYSETLSKVQTHMQYIISKTNGLTDDYGFSFPSLLLSTHMESINEPITIPSVQSKLNIATGIKPDLTAPSKSIDSSGTLTRSLYPSFTHKLILNSNSSSFVTPFLFQSERIPSLNSTSLADISVMRSGDSLSEVYPGASPNFSTITEHFSNTYKLSVLNWTVVPTLEPSLSESDNTIAKLSDAPSIELSIMASDGNTLERYYTSELEFGKRYSEPSFSSASSILTYADTNSGPEDKITITHETLKHDTNSVLLYAGPSSSGQNIVNFGSVFPTSESKLLDRSDQAIFINSNEPLTTETPPQFISMKEISSYLQTVAVDSMILSPSVIFQTASSIPNRVHQSTTRMETITQAFTETPYAISTSNENPVIIPPTAFITESSITILSDEGQFISDEIENILSNTSPLEKLTTDSPNVFYTEKSLDTLSEEFSVLSTKGSAMTKTVPNSYMRDPTLEYLSSFHWLVSSEVSQNSMPSVKNEFIRPSFMTALDSQLYDFEIESSESVTPVTNINLLNSDTKSSYEQNSFLNLDLNLSNIVTKEIIPSSILPASYSLIDFDTSKPKPDIPSETKTETASYFVSSPKTVYLSLSESRGILTKDSFVNDPSRNRFRISQPSSQVESTRSPKKQLSLTTEIYLDADIRHTSEEGSFYSVDYNSFQVPTADSKTSSSLKEFSSEYVENSLSRIASNPAILPSLDQNEFKRGPYYSSLTSSDAASNFHSLWITSSNLNSYQLKISTSDYQIYSSSVKMTENSLGTTNKDSSSFDELSTILIASDSMPVTDNPFSLVSAGQQDFPEKSYLSEQSFQEPSKSKDDSKTAFQVYSTNDPFRSSYSVFSEFLQDTWHKASDESGIFVTESALVLPKLKTESIRVSINTIETEITPTKWSSLSASVSPLIETFPYASSDPSTIQEPFTASPVLAASSVNNIQSRFSTISSQSASRLSQTISPTPASLYETPMSTYESAMFGVSSSIFPTPIDQTTLLFLTLQLKPSVNINDPTLIQELENGLLECYEEGAYKLRHANLRKRRQAANVGDAVTNVKVTDITRNVDEPSNVDVEFYVSENGDPVQSIDVENTLNQLSLVELSAYLAYPVISRPRAVTKVTKTEEDDDDTPVPILIIIPIVILIVAIVVVVIVIYCCRKNMHSGRIKTRHSLVPSLTLKKPTLDEMDLMIDMEKGEVVSRRSNTSTLNVKAGGSNTNTLSTALQKLQETGAEKVSEMPLRLNTIHYFQRSFSEICSPQDRLERLKSLGLNVTEIHTRTLYQISEANSNSENVADAVAEQLKTESGDKTTVNKDDTTPYSSLKTDDPIFDLSSSESNQSQPDDQNLIQIDREERLWNKVTFMANDGYLSDSSPRNKKASQTRTNRLDTRRTQRQSVGNYDSKTSSKDRALKHKDRRKRYNASRELEDRDPQRSHPSVHGYSNKIFDNPITSTIPNHRHMGDYTSIETDTDSVCLPSSTKTWIMDSDSYCHSDLDTESDGRFEEFRRGDPYSDRRRFDKVLNGHDLPVEAVNDVMHSYLKPKEQLYVIDSNDLHTDGSEYAGYEFDSVNFSSNYKPAFTPPSYKYYSQRRKHMEMTEPLVQYPEPSDPSALEHVTKMGRVGSRGLPPPTYKPRFRPIPFQEQRKPPTPDPEPEPQQETQMTTQRVMPPPLQSYEPYEEMKLGRNMRAVPRGGVRAVTSTNMQLDRDASEPLISTNPPSNIVVDYLANTTSPLTAPSHHKNGRQTSHQPSPRSVVTPQHPSQDLIEMLNRNQSMNISRFEEQQRIIDERKREADRKAQEQIREQERKEEEERKRALEEIEKLEHERQEEEWKKQAEIRRMREQREEEYRLEIERKNQEEMERQNRETREERLRQERIEAEKQHERDIQTKNELLRDSFALSPPPQTSKDLFTSNTTQQQEKSTDQGSSLPFIPHTRSLNFGTETGGSTLTTKTDTYHGKTDDSKFDKQETVDEVQDIEEDLEVEQASNSDSDEFNHF